MRLPSFFAALLSAGAALNTHASEATRETPATDEDNGVFILGVMDVRVEPTSVPFGTTSIGQDDMAALNLNTVSAALATQSGASVSRTNRNEDIIAIRGFDSRQVPVFLDGIPLYVPYDGYVDFGRFTTFDLARIDVSKGGASLLYGPNTLGGAINLVSRKPVDTFEGDLRVGAGSGSRQMSSLNLGSRQGNWYGQLGLSRLEVDTFPLGRGFEDEKRVPTDTGSNRENAYSNDWKASLKVGYTPNATDEYALGYSRQEGEKGNPVYTGRSNQGIRFWQWPFWDKESVYLLTSTAIGENDTLKMRVFHDSYDNRIDAFTNATYTTPGQTAAFPAINQDRNIGASMEWINVRFANHELHAALHFKEDRHDELVPRTPASRYRDVTQTLALQDNIRLSDISTLKLSLSYEERDAREVHVWSTGSTDATNGVMEYTRNLNDDTDAFVTVSHKTRFPTIKDRYSVRLGRALPNPDLAPEVALHVETGVRTAPWQDAVGSATVFYSRIDDLIQTRIVASKQCGGLTCDQARNVGEARHRGVELALDQRIGEQWQIRAAYTWLDMDNLDDRNIPLTGSPEHRIFTNALWQVNNAWEIILTAEAESGRIVPFAGTGQSQFRDLNSFNNWGLKALWKPTDVTRIEAGVDNLHDKSYELSDGIPLPGRTWYMNATLEF